MSRTYDASQSMLTICLAFEVCVGFDSAGGSAFAAPEHPSARQCQQQSGRLAKGKGQQSSQKWIRRETLRNHAETNSGRNSTRTHIHKPTLDKPGSLLSPSLLCRAIPCNAEAFSNFAVACSQKSEKIEKIRLPHLYRFREDNLIITKFLLRVITYSIISV